MTIKAWGPLFALLGLFAIGGIGLFLEHSKPHDYRQPAKAEDGNRPVGEFGAAIGTEQHSEKGEQERSWYKEAFDKPTDWLLALFTAFLVLYTRRLYQATAGLVESTNRLWDAGERQLVHLDSTARRQLRAYVFVDTVLIKHVQDSHGVPEATVRIKNFGQTPAYEVHAVGGFALSVHPPPGNLKLTITDADLNESKSKSSMGPGQTEIFIATPRPQFNRPFTEQEIAELANGVGTIYVYGRIRYRDAFGDTQWTAYRFMVGGPVGFASGGEMAGCEEGNEAT